MEREQFFRTNLDAVAAGRALGGIHHRQTELIHGDGVELANGCAITQAKAAPGTVLAAAGHGRGSAATAQSLVVGAQSGDMTAAGTGQTGDALVGIAHIHAQDIGDVGIHVRSIDGAAGRLNLAFNQVLGEVAAAGRATGAAVGLGQQFGDLVDAGIFVDVQALVGSSQHPGQAAAQDGHESAGKHHPSHRIQLRSFVIRLKHSEIKDLLVLIVVGRSL